MRICFILCSVITASAAVTSAASASAPHIVTLIVRSDARTGKLVRSVARPLRPAVAERSSAPQIVLPPSEDSAPAALRHLVDRIAEQHEVDRDLVHSVIRIESNYNPLAVSNKGALGLMQLYPSTARRFGVANSFNPEQNVDGGVRYLKYLLDLYKGDNRLVLAAYNAGEGTVERYRGIPPYPETQRYVFAVGKKLDQTKEAKRRNAKAEKPVIANGGYNPIRAFLATPGKVYYKTQ
jgi:soluble lytic murein transglycosylase-like protein